ncbi:MAG: glucose-1-phosphate thymidylyltransferase [Bacteroidota bacterium]
MKAVITSAGRGTRLRPITHTQNKHLIAIANKPMLHYAIESVRDAGITEIGIVVPADSNEVPNAVGNGMAWGANITYIRQEGPLGLAHVVKISQQFVRDDAFLFYLGDNIVLGGVRRFVEAFERSGCNCLLTLAKVKDPQRFGVPVFRGNRIVAVEEKPKQAKSSYAVAGIYVYDHHIFEAVNNIKPSARGELEISDAHQYLIDRGRNVEYCELTGWWKDTGKPSDLLEANRLVLENIEPRIEGTLDAASDVAGRVVIEKGATIMNSKVRGPAIIGEQCVIEESYIGPNTSIGSRTTVRKSEVEYSIIMQDCRIDSVGIRIESSLLGNDVEVVLVDGRPRVHRFMIGDQSRVEVA